MKKWFKLIVAMLLVIFLVVIAVFTLAEKAPGKSREGPAKDPVNVILFIGDGMGFTQLSAARLDKGAPLALDGMAYTGYLATRSNDAVVTDSAAAATALAAGVKTNNGMVGVAPNGQRLKTVLEAAEEAGRPTGLITTTRISYATPASFAAHVSGRGEESVIVRQLLDSDVDVILGGGRSFFLPKWLGGRLDDDVNLLEDYRSRGYAVVASRDELAAALGDKVLGLFAKEHMSYDQDRNRDREPSLAEMTARAIDILDQKNKGFFLMAEGGRIDHASHNNDGPRTVSEVKAFDEAVAVALEYASQKPDTLVVVTADHETGGMSLKWGGEYGWTTAGHTGVVVPVIAQGPQAEKFMGLRDNTEVAGILAAVMGVRLQ